MEQLIIVLIIIFLTIFYVGYKIYKSIKNRCSYTCGCNGCSIKEKCKDIKTQAR